jgi:hypothetical protein
MPCAQRLPSAKTTDPITIVVAWIAGPNLPAIVKADSLFPSPAFRERRHRGLCVSRRSRASAFDPRDAQRRASTSRVTPLVPRLLKEIAPRVTRAAVLRDPAIPAGFGEFGAIQAVAPSLRIELRPIDMRDAGEIERAVTAFARSSNGGLIVTSNAWGIVHRDLIIALASRHRLPVVYPFRVFITAGGLASYGPDTIDPHRRAAGYIDRILKGEKPADLPVQAPTKFELAINLKTAKALGLDIPTSVLARADEAIE